MDMQVSTLYGSGAWDQHFEQSVRFVPGETENKVVNLYPELSYQSFEGFGGAITEAAGWVYARMDEEQKKKLTETYFSPDRMGYRFVRIPIDSCDFSLSQYEGFERVEQYILPLLRDAEKAAGGKLGIMLAPWSPPAKWKTNGRREGGGRLLEEHYGDWADYLCDAIAWYREKGFSVTMLSLQNEAHAVQTWDSCLFTAQEEKRFLRDHMYPAMLRRGLADVAIYLWDHNKERVYEWLRDIVDGETAPMVEGMAFHWYSGDHFEALDLCRERFPDKKLMVSESCIEFYKFTGKDASDLAISMTHEILGDLNHGACAFGDWNLLLDERGGPNYAGNFCLAPFLFDTKEKKLRQTLLGQYMEKLAGAIVPGSVRIAATKYAETVDVSAWRRPDGSIALLLLNKSGDNAPVCVRLNGLEAGTLLFPRSLSVLTIR